jgi:hypothetical protein
MELDDGSVDTVLAGIDDSFLEEQQDMNSINVNISLNDELDRIASIDSSLWVESLLQEDVDNSTVVSFERHEDDVGWTGTECGAHPREDQHIVIRQVSNIADVATAQQSLTQPINVPTFLDVVNGCGRGILKLPGNETYRELVSLNKRIYARCHHLDKAKVSQGIVAAIRDFGADSSNMTGNPKPITILATIGRGKRPANFCARVRRKSDGRCPPIWRQVAACLVSTQIS